MADKNHGLHNLLSLSQALYYFITSTAMKMLDISRDEPTVAQFSLDMEKLIGVMKEG